MSRLPISAPSRPHSPWQWFYGSVHRLRERWYRDRASSLPKPVISIGNLHWGGTGKTPLTAAIAAHLRDRGLSVAILSRGYGSKPDAGSAGTRKSRDGVRVVSRGDGPLLGPRIAGDEPVLLASQLPGVAVVVCPDRARAGRHALERLDRPPDLFLLDDGFSHLRLRRDLDLLVFPASDPFAGGRLPPSGRLREPLASARRAHAVILSGHEDGDNEESREDPGHALALALRPHGFSGPGFVARTEASPARPLTSGEVAPGSKVLVVSAIARPGRFLATVRDQGFEIVGDLSFPDHHRYPQESLERIEEQFRQSGADWVLITGKDRVKLRGRSDLPVAEIPILSRPESEFFRWLDLRVDDLLGATAET
jgi:tetraacyldisaccharide 4'-kinase